MNIVWLITEPQTPWVRLYETLTRIVNVAISVLLPVVLLLVMTIILTSIVNVPARDYMHGYVSDD